MTAAGQTLPGQLVLTVAAPAASPSATADYYFSITFNAQVVEAGTETRIESGFHKSPFSNYDQSNDYSFDSSKSTFTLHDKVTLYRQGTLVWGTPP